MFRKLIAGAILLCPLISLQVFASQDILIPKAAYTTSQTSPVQVKTQEQVIHVIINVTSAPNSGTLTPTIFAQDALGNSYPLVIGAAISTTGITVLKVGRGIGQITNQASADYVPDLYYVTVTASTANTATYGVTINRGQ